MSSEALARRAVQVRSENVGMSVTGAARQLGVSRQRCHLALRKAGLAPPARHRLSPQQQAVLLDRLVRARDAGLSVTAAARQVGMSSTWCEQALQKAGLEVPKRRRRVTTEQVAAKFEELGTLSGTAKALGVGPNTVRRHILDAGLTPPAPRAKPQEKRRCLELMAQGMSAEAAAREVGVNPTTAGDWRRGARKYPGKRVLADGRVVYYGAAAARYEQSVTSSDADAAADEPGRYLTLEQRKGIADGLINKMTMREIGLELGRAASTISREIRRHACADGRYRPHRADTAAQAARARPKTSKLVDNQALRAIVDNGLRQRRSPEQIARRLRKDYPDDESMRVSHETIYQALYFQARGGLKREVQQSLRSGRTRRKPRSSPQARTNRFRDSMIMISDRPAEVEDRAVPGHWEGDLITGTLNQSAIGTLVERSTRYVMLLHLPHGHHSEAVRDALIAAISTLPGHLRGSLTWDQGSEMALHQQFSIAADIDVYFCDPGSPWQRGSNENTNGLLRQYFPKGTDLNQYGPADLEYVAQELNNRPRKTLDWDTPAERLTALLSAQ